MACEGKLAVGMKLRMRTSPPDSGGSLGEDGELVAGQRAVGEDVADYVRMACHREARVLSRADSWADWNSRWGI